MTSSVMRVVVMAVLAIDVAVMVEEASAQTSATIGNLRGVVRDKATDEGVVGATIVATSRSLLGEQVAVTEDDGQYFLTSLPPGMYELTVYYADDTYTRRNILIQVGKDAVVNLSIDSRSAKGETIVLTGTAPIIDQGSTKTGLTLTDDYTRNLPTARTFGGVVGQAAGAQGDNYGVSFAGATSAENVYIVEGINTTDTGFGGIASNLPNEFVQETEVITGGYNAEFGRATGGIVNVVTKQGSDEFHGSVFAYVQPGALISEANVIQREGGSIDSKTNLDYRYDLGAELGGPIVREKLWFHVGFNPAFTSETTTRLVQRQVDGTDGRGMDGLPDVDEETGITKHELVSKRDVPARFQQYYFTAKLSGAIDQNHQFQVSGFGNPRRATDLYQLTGNPQMARWRYSDGAYDGSARWTSKFGGGKTQIDAVAGYHHGFQRQAPLSDDQNVPYMFYQYDRSLYDFANLEGASSIAGCEDGGAADPYPEIQNCPVFGYAEQGIDLLENQTKSRSSIAAALTHRVRALGTHVLKVGIDAELARFDNNSRYSGGVRWRRTDDTLWQAEEYFQFIAGADPDAPLEPGQVLCANDQGVCERGEGLVASTTNRNIAAFAQDSWQIQPNLTLNVGLRWEQQIGRAAKHLQGKQSPEGEVIPRDAYALDHLWAPRVGLIYDPTRDGKSKLFGHWGRFYENVPMDLNVRAFGGEIIGLTDVNVSRTPQSAGGYDANCDVDHSPSISGTERAMSLDECGDRGDTALLGGGTEYVSPGLRGQYTEEFVVGAEYEIRADLKLGANLIYRNLPVVIEDISVDGGNTYLITNPGFNFDGEAETLETEAAQLMTSGDDQDAARAALLLGRATSLRAVKRLEKPVRDYAALQLTATQRPTKQWLLIASYTYSRSKGNYPGLFSTETGQNDPNITSLYDLPDLMANRYGPLGLDRPHNVKLDAFRAFDFGRGGAFVVGASFRALSGIPHNVLGAHPIYGTGESYLLGRGTSPRSPFTTQLDTRLAYAYPLRKGIRLEAFVNVFNLLDSQQQLNTDENYTFDSANPVIGGNADDLAHVKTINTATGRETNATPRLNKNYGNTGGNTVLIAPLQQAPRAVELGMRLTF
ncbi:MAG: TonB-dependent receptor domain-containing protein [Kofleriaceae bacterium]